jgi:hypothetical protein
LFDQTTERPLRLTPNQSLLPLSPFAPDGSPFEPVRVAERSAIPQLVPASEVTLDAPMTGQLTIRVAPRSPWIATPLRLEVKEPTTSLCDWRHRPWDDAGGRPSRAGRRRALQRTMRAAEFQRLDMPQRWSEKTRHLLDGVVRLGA